MVKTCKKGTISRKGYVRHYKNKNSKNKTIRIKRTCIKSRSQSGLKRSIIDRKKIRTLERKHKSNRKKYGTPKCKSGQIIREGYLRHSYKRRKSGKKVHSVRVKPGCINATGLSKKTGIKGKPLFILQKGELTKEWSFTTTYLLPEAPLMQSEN